MIMLSMRRVGTLLALTAVLGGCVKISSAPAHTPVVPRSPTPVVAATPTPTPRLTTTPIATPAATPRPSLSRPSASPAPTATPDDGSQVVPVELADSLTITPGKINVVAGTPVKFVVTNTGALEHTFFIGSDKEQKQREAQTGEPGKNRFITVPPGETVELTMTFAEPGKTIAGCTIPGHYSGGMKAAVTIKAP